LQAGLFRFGKWRNTMTSAKFVFGILLLLISVFGAGLLHGASVPGDQSNIAAAGSSQQAGVHETWSGTFRSRYSDIAPFAITVVISSDASGNLIGSASIISDCLKDADLQVTIDGSNVTVAGSDQDGDTVTFQGTIDKTGTLVPLHYIINGSASGRCEVDDGTGSARKQ
jgi:hypothetical protein